MSCMATTQVTTTPLMMNEFIDRGRAWVHNFIDNHDIEFAAITGDHDPTMSVGYRNQLADEQRTWSTARARLSR